MLFDIIQFIVGLILVVKGADLLTDGGSSVAQRLRVPSLIIGLTVVALGTSLPEYVVSTISATKGNSDMSLGNVVGSNIFNTLAVVGITALFCPVVCRGALLRRDIPVNLVIAFLMPVLLLFVGAKMQLSRMEGVFLLVLFVTYMSFSIYQTVSRRSINTATTSPASIMPVWKQILYIVLGLAMLIVGGDWFVDSASDIATLLGVSQSIIALTIVSIGTSLPELATSVIAARKGDTDMAMGNVVGSNIFNILLIVGTSAAIMPICPEGIDIVDLATMALAITLLTMLLLLSRRHVINRWKGCVLVVVAIAYYTYLVLSQ